MPGPGRRMIEAAPEWGVDPDRVDAYALVGAEAIVRVLLPAWTESGQPARWSEVAAAFRREPPLDGSVSWHWLIEFPGAGTWTPAAHFAPPAGRFDHETRATLVGLLDDAAGSTPWRTDQPASKPGRLRDLSLRWTRDGFAGRAWTLDGRFGIAAPAYADSVFVSGPRELASRLESSRLEAFRIARQAPNPVTVD